jgi:3-phosphoshikimate 1-carboxyvinyltransferase
VAAQRRLVVPKDWSSASYSLAFAAVTDQSTFLPGLSADPLQADSVFASWLHDRGALDFAADGVRARGLADRGPCRWDLAPCPDLTPAVAFVCAHLEGESRLEGLGALVHKESDRLTELARLLTACGVSVRLEPEALAIQGGTVRAPGLLEPAADHRMVMTAALFLAAHGGGDLTHGTAVNKSFPGFFRAMGFQK